MVCQTTARGPVGDELYCTPRLAQTNQITPAPADARFPLLVLPLCHVYQRHLLLAAVAYTMLTPCKGVRLSRCLHPSLRARTTGFRFETSCLVDRARRPHRSGQCSNHNHVTRRPGHQAHGGKPDCSPTASYQMPNATMLKDYMPGLWVRKLVPNLGKLASAACVRERICRG